MSEPISKENRLINELIREYLEYNGYQNSLSVFANGEMIHSEILLNN